ncbi:MAG: DUF99 family protein [Crenarchaeota archaeon]|nr:DUF99 family protein [Thermoproteota archaeon]
MSRYLCDLMRITSLLGKRAVRAFGIAESFVLEYPRSIFCGVVYRSDGIVERVIIDEATVGGDDATDTVVRMFRMLERKDIHILMIDGCILSWYNILDLYRIYEEINIPVISIVFEDIEGDVERAILKIFPEEKARTKLELFRRLPEPVKIILRSGDVVYVRVVGIERSPRLLRTIVSRFIRDGKRPEPIRIAKHIAAAVLEKTRRELRQSLEHL